MTSHATHIRSWSFTLAKRPSRRALQLGVGLVLYGLSIALLVRAGLGVDSWDVLHQGLARSTGLSLGTIVNITSVFVLVLWAPLRQRPGWGTLANALVVGLVADMALVLLLEPHHILWQIPMLLAGIAVNGVATGLYIGAGLGAGPRDGLMTGLAARTGRSIRMVRTVIELLVVITGWLLGGTVGVGTVLYAVLIGSIAQSSINRFAIGKEPSEH